MAFNLKDSIMTGAIEGFVVNFFHSIGESASATAKEKGGEFLKAKVFGIGTNDEHLFLSACAYALNKGMVTHDQLILICKVIDSYAPSQRSRIIDTLGKTEDEVIMDDTEKTHIKANVKGAFMLAMLAKLDEPEMKKILETSGATNSFAENISKLTKNVTEKIEGGKFNEDCKDFFAKETFLEKLAREAKAKV